MGFLEKSHPTPLRKFKVNASPHEISRYKSVDNPAINL